MAYLDFPGFVDLLDEIFDVNDPEEIKWNLSSLSSMDQEETTVTGTLPLSAIRRHFGVGDDLSLNGDDLVNVILKSSGESENLKVKLQILDTNNLDASGPWIELHPAASLEEWRISTTPIAKTVARCLERC
jgi:hypothetical protein